MSAKLLVWGASGHALVLTDIIRLRGDYEIVGFLDDVNPERRNEKFLGLSILGGREQLDILQQRGIKHIILGFGDCEARLRLSNLVREKGFSLATAIHPRALVAAGVPIGPGTAIVGGAVVNPGARIGENVIINTCASVGHECVVEDGAHVAPGVRLGGRVVVARGAWVGIGSVVKERVRIGAGSIVGAGSVVVDDIPDGVMAYGTPAKVVKRLLPNEQ